MKKQESNSFKNSGKKIQKWDWRKLVKNVRDIASIVSVVLSLIKILQELGLILLIKNLDDIE
ncbi:hypothetical protein DSM106972_095160 [Dulcicalothrix desertica PCC 7102]|uniref:Uncharacterized protein n=1 Tax=Dulcicalothrix desertica PCC 7102 TaxID=232991 RepID=A0A3S1BZH8_9CYAN|nr:hypothetical protein [Dulcicalothrix desertica]RUS93917.1 hypothetical protein DSM106972_095160 [Dulcicalothrix desertica PCC 7102]TWH61605.1 hypothetical protein CAL7102_00829 [Dulcicalothrix desertica PCC 7102]